MLTQSFSQESLGALLWIQMKDEYKYLQAYCDIFINQLSYALSISTHKGIEGD
jgi:LPS O-antigen subunit length determinant protein (WzzB/FepE family)